MQSCFVNLRVARAVIEAWRVDYNTVRSHSSLAYLAPEEFAAPNGCGKDGGSSTLENAPRFPLSNSHDDESISTLAVHPMSRQLQYD
jgi:hypothetical protein